jgi:outer membrane murein-binding lipoprotein Lpp
MSELGTFNEVGLNYSPPATRSGAVRRKRNKSRRTATCESTRENKNYSNTSQSESAMSAEKTQGERDTTTHTQKTLQKYITKVNIDNGNPTTQKPSEKYQLKDVLEKISGVEKRQKAIDKKIELLVTKDFIEKLLEEKITNIKQEISSEVYNKVSEDIDTVKADLHQLRVELKTCREECSEIKDRLDKQATDVVNLNLENKKLQVKNEQLEQYSRRNSVRIFGIAEKTDNLDEGEDTIDKVIQLIDGHLGLANIRREHIDVAHRVGPIVENNPRPIIVKFISRQHRTEVLGNRKKLKGKKMIIVEDLTQNNQLLWKDTSKHTDVESAWTLDGTVHALLKSKKFVKVRCREDLGRLQQLVPYKTKK